MFILHELGFDLEQIASVQLRQLFVLFAQPQPHHCFAVTGDNLHIEHCNGKVWCMRTSALGKRLMVPCSCLECDPYTLHLVGLVLAWLQIHPGQRVDDCCVS